MNPGISPQSFLPSRLCMRLSEKLSFRLLASAALHAYQRLPIFFIGYFPWDVPANDVLLCCCHKYPDLRNPVLSFENVFLFFSQTISSDRMPATSRPSCSSRASADFFSKCTIAANSKPDSPCCKLAICVRSYFLLGPSPSAWHLPGSLVTEMSLCCQPHALVTKKQ